MKIISVINNFCDAGDAPRWYCKADTSLLRNNDAFYIPDSMGRIAAEPQIVIRISRLAKCIGERFAPRCYDEVALGVNFTAVDMLDRLRADSLPWEHAVGFDHSAALSNSTSRQGGSATGCALRSTARSVLPPAPMPCALPSTAS